MKKKNIILLFAAFCTLFMLHSCQDNESVVIGNNEDTLSNTSLITSFLTSLTVTDSEISSDCFAINYPVTVFSYNSNFQAEDTFVLENNQQLYSLLQNLQDDEYYAIDYPVSITISGGSIVSVDTNDALLAAIQNAVQNCNPDTGCDNPGVLVNDLVIYMPFSNTFDDLMGAEVTGSSSITFVPDRDGNEHCAVSFQGNQEFLHIASTEQNAIVDGDNFSISFWFRMQNTEAGNLEDIFTKGPGGNGFTVGVYDMNTPLFLSSDFNLWDQPWNGNSELWNDTEHWHHLVITLNNDHVMKLYRDGQIRQDADFSGHSISADAMDYYLGQYFQGYLDDLRVYKRTLSADDVHTLYELEGDCNTCLNLE